MADWLDRFATELGLDATVVESVVEALAQQGRLTLVPMELAEPLDAVASPPGAIAPEGYEDLGQIGMGGMGEVRRVRDLRVDRVVAMKILREDLAQRPDIVARFNEEAQATAQLEHPGIVPVHELGRLPDGRLYFTMKLVRGRTLTRIIDAVHQASSRHGWGVTEDGWTFRRLMNAFHRVCETVAHAHARAVLHRDLKPDNVMIGDFGEVLVVDWGLAKVGGSSPQGRDLEVVRTERSRTDSLSTRVGTVQGTPMYMAPEQARGEIHRLDPRTDVYALGAILYQILSGRTPYPPGGSREILDRLIRGDRPAPPEGLAPVPEELADLCIRAMAHDPDQRPADGAEVAAQVVGWLEGVRKREQALAVVAEAEQAMPAIEATREEAADLWAQAERRLAEIRPWDPVQTKRSVWQLQDQARDREVQAQEQEQRVTALLHAALTHAPDLPEAKALLADLYHRRHQEAEVQRDKVAARRYEILLQNTDDGRYARYLAGHGSVSVVTDPPGAEVEILRYVERDRQLTPEPVANLGPLRTPLHDLDLPRGSYLLRLKAPGREEVRLPVHIRRASASRGIRPGSTQPHPIPLPPVGTLGPDDLYIPAGWFQAGGDPGLPADLTMRLREVWVDGFIIRRYPVTNAEYLTFLNDLVRHGREDEALRHVPRERAGASGKPGAVVYGRRDDGTFCLEPDADGDVWAEDWPVLLVDWHGATAFGAWEAQRTGQPWRLPGELEWEKASRGVDGRYFPWGDVFDATFACARESRPGRPLPAAVTDFPADRSPYGVRGTAGNVRELCLDLYLREGAPDADGIAVLTTPRADDPAVRVSRGGGWSLSGAYARSCVRVSVAPEFRAETMGFRLARSLGPAGSERQIA